MSRMMSGAAARAGPGGGGGGLGGGNTLYRGVTIKEFFREKERSSPGEPQGQSSPPQVYRRCKVDISA